MKDAHRCDGHAFHSQIILQISLSTLSGHYECNQSHEVGI